MHELSVVQALLIALWVALVMSRVFLGGATTTLRFTPMMTGLVVGIVMGDVPQAMITVAGIQLIYMGVFSPGGQMPSEPAIAAAVAVSVALLGDMKPETAIGIAVPVGLLGTYLYQFRFFINTFVMQKYAEKYAKEANSRGLTTAVITIPVIISFVIFVPTMFVALYFGAPVIKDLVETNAGGVIFHVLDVIGGGLAAIGIAVTVYVIGKKNYIAFFLMAFFMATMLKELNITMVTYAIVGSIIAFVFVLAKNEAGESVKASIGSAMTGMTGQDEDDDDY